MHAATYGSVQGLEEGQQVWELLIRLVLKIT